MEKQPRIIFFIILTFKKQEVKLKFFTTLQLYSYLNERDKLASKCKVEGERDVRTPLSHYTLYAFNEIFDRKLRTIEFKTENCREKKKKRFEKLSHTFFCMCNRLEC